MLIRKREVEDLRKLIDEQKKLIDSQLQLINDLVQAKQGLESSYKKIQDLQKEHKILCRDLDSAKYHLERIEEFVRDGYDTISKESLEILRDEGKKI